MKFKIFGGGSSAVTTFTDSFNRADQPSMLGDQWLCTPTSQSTIVGGSNLAASINVAGGNANFSICSSNGANQIVCSPVPITWDVVFGASQFSQCAIQADNSGGANFGFIGPCVLANVNAATGYMIQTNIIFGVGNSVGKYTVVSMNGGAAQTAINNNGGAGFSFAIGDLLRIEAFPATPSAGKTTIKTFKNGTQQSSDVDSTNHYSFGVFGIWDYFTSVGITQSFNNFFGGKR